ncbi:MAG TPA: 2-hydroxyhepta-2,4-diene-1,7-dioate isomerase [Legionella sp.]|nr:2-hydroxyhepta-2,4-diene-1,7-dioate isomerase [Legionella sp.]
MRWVRFGEMGAEKPGLLDTDGHIRDVSGFISDVNPSSLGNMDLMAQLKTIDLGLLPIVDPSVRIGACVGMPGKLICVGFNSRLHAKEMGVQPVAETEMVVFFKPTCAICGPFDPILYTRNMKKLDWEAELGVVIGKKGKYIPIEAASDYILGYTCINDLSERYLQLETGDKQYTKGKGFDNAAPIGPYLVTKEDVSDSSDLNIKLWVNGVLRQAFNTGDYIHSDVEVVSYLSQYFTLYPGDIISMGSAPGSARSWGEGIFLKPNDQIVFTIQGLGQQEQVVVVE